MKDSRPQKPAAQGGGGCMYINPCVRFSDQPFESQKKNPPFQLCLAFYLLVRKDLSRGPQEGRIYD